MVVSSRLLALETLRLGAGKRCQQGRRSPRAASCHQLGLKLAALLRFTSLTGTGESERLQIMKAYRIVVHDSRAAGPIELNAEMKHDARVTEYCRERLASSAQVSSIEIWSGVIKLCHLWSEARAAA